MAKEQLQNLEEVNVKVIKRDNTVETYSQDKMRKFLMKVCDNNENYVTMIMEKCTVTLKSKNEIKISELIDTILRNTISLISPLYPNFDVIAARLYITQIRKNATGSYEYPRLADILQEGVKSKVYAQDWISSYSKEDIEYFDSIVEPSRDDMFVSYKAIKVFHDKYCVKKSKTITLELPQHAYMRVAMFLNHKEASSKRRECVKNTYDSISLHKYTLATPIMINSGSPNSQMASCVLIKTNDDSRSILKAGEAVGIYSKYKGGTALDVSQIRANGSLIAKSGTSSGAIPFIKIFNEVICAWNQGSTRKGACAIYYPIYHLDVESLLPLKDSAGTETTRARDLMYAIKIDDMFVERWMANEDYTLFDPKDTPLLASTYGEEFKKAYLDYENMPSLRKRKINARTLFDQVLKYRVETGNLYIFFSDNVNKQNLLNSVITQSNLCLTGDTKLTVRLDDELEEREVRLDEVEELLKTRKVYVKSHNLETREDEFNLVYEFLDKGVSSDLYLIETYGRSITCTGDHKIFTLNRGYVKASELCSYDGLLAHKDIIVFPILIHKYENLASRVYDINVDKVHNFYANGILVHNCTEITLPTEGGEFKEEIVDYSGENIVQVYDAKEKIALCNLASINLEKYNYMSEEEKEKLYYDIVRTLDNTVDVSFYPLKSAELPNKKSRYLGIGVSNLANYLALNKIVIDTQESLEEQAKIFDDISYGLIKASMELAKEKGRARGFEDTKYARGLYPYKLGNDKAKELTNYKPNIEKWESLAEEVKKHGLRNCTLMAIAPTACARKDTKIITDKGIKSYKEIMEEQGINHTLIEESNGIGWYEFREPIFVDIAEEGAKEAHLILVNRIWYNGSQPTRTLTFSDGTKACFTLNHRLLNDSNEWICVSDIKVGDKFPINKDLGLYVDITEISNTEYNHTYDIEVTKVHKYKLANGVFSHNTSGQSISATESTDPVFENGVYSQDMSNGTVKCVVPNFKKNNQYYKTAFECDQVMLIKGAAVRQLFLDQAQSVTLYNASKMKEDGTIEDNWLCASSQRLSIVHFYAHSLGLKTLYYIKSKKIQTEEKVCESCT